MAHTMADAEQLAAFQLDDMHCPECADAVERALRAQQHITSVHLDWLKNVVHVGYHPAMISPDAIEQVIASTGCACAPAQAGDGAAHDHAEHTQPAQARRLQRLQHAVDVQPITMGTKHDRMQYELPATGALRQAVPTTVPPTPP
ncbi:MAG: heavy metal-associated domain-containing protein, partial [Roseiflexaceae bacterium]